MWIRPTHEPAPRAALSPYYLQVVFMCYYYLVKNKFCIISRSVNGCLLPINA